MTTTAAQTALAQTTTSTHWIPKGSLPDLRKAVSKLEKKAARLGLFMVSWRLTGREEVRSMDRYESNPNDYRDPVCKTYRVRCVEVEVTSPQITVAGFTLIAAVEPRQSGNIIRSVGGDLPPEYRDCAMVCDHCRVSRRRKCVYVVREDATGRLLSVGSTCLEDFTRTTTATAAAAGFEHLADAIACFRGYGTGCGPTADLGWALTQFLACVLEEAAQHGFVTRKDLERLPEWTRTTGSEAWEALTDGQVMRRRFGAAMTYEALAERHGVEAAAIVAWHVARQPVSDFEHNCHVLATDDALTYRDANVAAAMVLPYRRAVREAAERTAAAQAPHGQAPQAPRFDAAVGARVRDLRVVCERIKPMDARAVAHNVTVQSHLHIFRTADGAILKWFASSEVLREGGEYVLTGTVKAQGDYRGVPETMLTRCAVREAPASAAA